MLSSMAHHDCAPRIRPGRDPRQDIIEGQTVSLFLLQYLPNLWAFDGSSESSPVVAHVFGLG